jgi:uncharacterized membrane protein (UPF0127 family)
MRYTITHSRTGAVVAADAVLADSPLSRMKGLLGRRSMPANEAIILRPASSIHTLFMRFALDVIYLDREDTVVKVVPDLVPWRFSAASGGHTVIEMAAGATKGLGIEAGDRLVLTPLEAGQGAGSTS